MSDSAHSPTTAAPVPPVEPGPATGGSTSAGEGGGAPSGAQQMAAGAKQAFSEASEKPEALVGAAFAGGLVVALILKRLTRG